jgi:hypothetical protein
MEVPGELHAPAFLLPGKEPPGTHCIGGWAGPGAGLNAENRTPAFRPVARSVQQLS